MTSGRALAGACVGWIGATGVLAVVAAGPQALSSAALDEALRLARTRQPSELDRFTAPYLVVRGGPGSPSVEVITEYRRAVIIARRQVDMGVFTWSTRNLSEAIAKYAGLTTVRAEIWLPPVNTFVTTPKHRMDLYDGSTRTVAPVAERHDPIYSTILSEQPSLAGVALESMYRAERLQEPGCCRLIVVGPRGESLVEQQIAFPSLR